MLLAFSGCGSKTPPATEPTEPQPSVPTISDPATDPGASEPVNTDPGNIDPGNIDPGNEDTKPGDTEPDNGGSKEEFPPVKDITVSREGQEEVLPAYLQASDKGYVIYLLEDFILELAAGGDVVQPSESSPMLKTINMRIVLSDGQQPLPENEEKEGILIKYHRITKGDKTFDVTMNYPLEAAEGGGVLLRVMLDSLEIL